MNEQCSNCKDPVMNTKQPPDRIYLQWHCGEHDADYGDPEPGNVTWCEDSIFEDDVEYVRVDTNERTMQQV